MRAKRAKGWFWIIIACVVIGLPMLQLLGKEKHKHDPVQMMRLLHQVSMFQTEVLSNQWLEAAQAQTVDALMGLNQAAYSVNYTHQRFMLAQSSTEMVPLASVEYLLQYLMHLEMSGKRELASEDSALLQESADVFHQILPVYAQLLANNGKLIRSKNEEAIRYDQQIQALFKARLLE